MSGIINRLNVVHLMNWFVIADSQSSFDVSEFLASGTNTCTKVH